MATPSPSITTMDETLSTINYAADAKGIVNKPIATTYLTVSNDSNNTSHKQNFMNIKTIYYLFLGIKTQST